MRGFGCRSWAAKVMVADLGGRAAMDARVVPTSEPAHVSVRSHTIASGNRVSASARSADVAETPARFSGAQPTGASDLGAAQGRPWRARRSTWVAADPLVGHRRAVVMADIVAVLLASALAYFARSAVMPAGTYTAGTVAAGALVIGLVWIGVLASTGAYDMRFFEVRSEEYRRVLLASVVLTGLVATTSYLLELQFSRGFLIIEIPLGTALLLFSRLRMRRRLQKQRRKGIGLKRAVLVGEDPGAAELTDAIRRDNTAGLLVVDTVHPPAEEADAQLWVDALLDQIVRDQASAVVLASHPKVDRALVRAVAWRLEGPGVDLLVSPDFVAVAGPRITIRQASDLPLIHLDEPRLSGQKRFVKRSIDIAGSLAALALCSPILLASAVAVRLSSPGPVFFRQVRVGAAGEEFTVIKFRTMVQGAAQEQAEVWARGSSQGTANKLRDDPRVTAPGRILRRWSIDELPQLFNVLSGYMSLVGPRPLQPSEVEALPPEHDRRHLTKPGMTGLWQVSGRNDLPWDERMRLDLRYVEHWSVSLDIVILLRTVKAVLVGSGAY